jgi:hypothetical protein
MEMGTQEESLATQMDCMAVGNGEDTAGVEWAKYSKRVLIKKIIGRPDGGQGLVGQRVVVGGWVKTGREQGKNTFVFLEVNDGSCPANLQVCMNTINKMPYDYFEAFLYTVFRGKMVVILFLRYKR